MSYHKPENLPLTEEQMAAIEAANKRYAERLDPVERILAEAYEAEGASYIIVGALPEKLDLGFGFARVSALHCQLHAHDAERNDKLGLLLAAAHEAFAGNPQTAISMIELAHDLEPEEANIAGAIAAMRAYMGLFSGLAGLLDGTAIGAKCRQAEAAWLELERLMLELHDQVGDQLFGPGNYPAAGDKDPEALIQELFKRAGGQEPPND